MYLVCEMFNICTVFSRQRNLIALEEKNASNMKYHFKEPHKQWSTNESSFLKEENLINIILRDYKLFPHTSTCLKKCSQRVHSHTHTHTPGTQHTSEVKHIVVR